MRIFLVIFLTILLMLPAYSYTGDNQDTWPAFFGMDNALKDNGFIVFYDQGAGAFDAPRLVAGDLLVNQWTPQRNAIGWRTDGRWNVSFIEDANDLEIWESPDTDWQDEAGAWGLLDDDISEDWDAVDVETRQNYVWCFVHETTNIHGGYIDLVAGAPAWTIDAATQAVGDNQFSLVLDDALYGVLHGAHTDGIGNAAYCWCNNPPDTWGSIVIAAGACPQIVCDTEVRLYPLYTSGNALRYVTDLAQWGDPAFVACGAIFTAAGTLDDDYHVTWLKIDNTLHVAVVDFVAAANSTTLNYIRRTPNGWDAPVVLLTVDSSNPAFDSLEWPQITVDPFGAIFIYYILNPDWTAGAGGDLQGFYLDASVYSNPVVGNWVQYTDIDDEVGRVLWVVAPDSIPIGGDM